jgi:elongation factor Ts
MAEISAASVKQLREKTGAGMMDCKRALTETSGDAEAAVDWLRKKGLATAAKKAGRVAADGLVGVVARGAVGALVEVNAETDFVARNEQFQAFVTRAAELALDVDDLAALKAADYGDGRTVADALTQLIATVGENMTLRRMEKLSVAQGVVASYMHSAVAPGLGKIGVIVGVTSSTDPTALTQLGKTIAMHVAAAKPLVAARADLDPALVERERKVLREQALEQGKPAEIVDKMIEGRMRKFYEEVVLAEQVFVMDTDKKVSAVIEATAKELGAPVAVTGFAKFVLGEGVEKAEDDFAAEVAKLAG